MVINFYHFILLFYEYNMKKNLELKEIHIISYNLEAIKLIKILMTTKIGKFSISIRRNKTSYHL